MKSLNAVCRPLGLALLSCVITLAGCGGSDGQAGSSSSSSASSSSSSSTGSTVLPPVGNIVLEGTRANILANVQVVDNNAIGYFDGGDHFGFRGVDMNGVTQMVLRYGSANNHGDVMEIRADNTNGHLLATVNARNTGDYSNFQDFTININATTGARDLYFVGKSGQGILNLDKVTLVRSGSLNSGRTPVESSTASGAAACNDGNSTHHSGSMTVSPGKCYKYSHGSGKLQLGSWSLREAATYEVKNCNGVVTTATQALNTYTSLATQANHCDHYIYVKSAPGNYNLQLGSW